MAGTETKMEITFPDLPVPHAEFMEYVAAHPDTPMSELTLPYKQYDAELRKVLAQQPEHPKAKESNLVPIFNGKQGDIKIRARNLEAETEKETDAFIMPLKDEDRRANGSPAIVQSLKEFQTNFSVFAETSLADLDWSNVIAAGSSVVTSLLSVPGNHGESKRALRRYYHETLAPASDVDLFLYGLTEEQAIEKIKQIERNVRDALLVETTTIRTKNAITIASQYPTRHVQIVLRIYNSISEILTGFDVDCSCVAYDGKQVYASPRALASYMTQVNTIDLTRRSPSYENRLAKYAARGFEVHWPNLDRLKIDPTIFERSFIRTEGLARLLILEKLPKSEDRDAYLDQRRAERGRPQANRQGRQRHQLWGNIKDRYENEVAEWDDSEEVSDYHTITVPYGEKFHARKIEKLLYTKDLLLNSEWNKSDERGVNLHRHPAFFGSAEDVMGDCCGYCPVPSNVEEEEVAEEESKKYITGPITFIKDNPGRQEIGSFNPITTDDWTNMAYVSNTGMLCQAIIDEDVEYVRSWLEQEGNDPNARDWTGRAPLHLAASNSSAGVVQVLIDHGARIVARLVDGKTALHIAAMRGSVDIVSALLRKSEANEEEEENRIDAKRAARKAEKKESKSKAKTGIDGSDEDEDIEMIDESSDTDLDATTENSIVKIKSQSKDEESQDKTMGDDKDEPDVYDVNVVAWDTSASALHFAIIKGQIPVVKCLVQEFGADILLPIKKYSEHNPGTPLSAILTLVLALELPMTKAEEMARVLVELGASVAQADMNQATVLQHCVANRPEHLELLHDVDKTGFDRAINHLSASSARYNFNATSSLLTAIRAKDGSTALKLLGLGIKPSIEFSDFMKSYQTKFEATQSTKENQRVFSTDQDQPIVLAVNSELPLIAKSLIEDCGVDPNTLGPNGHRILLNPNAYYVTPESLLDIVRNKIEQLAEWKPREANEKAPIPLKADEHYLSKFADGSYAAWTARNKLERAKVQYKTDLKNCKGKGKCPTCVGQKQDAISQLKKEFEQLESAMVDGGAKTFRELHPEREYDDKSSPRNRYNYNKQEPPKPFEMEFSFNLPDVSDELRERYMDLFEAVWAGNVTKAKELTLLTWQDENDEEQPPLRIAIQDDQSLFPFAIAVIKGNFDLAGVIMDIAQAQYVPQEDDSRRRYNIDNDDDDDYSDSDDEGSLGDDNDVRVVSELINDQFTIETIGQVSMQVKSRISPVKMLQMQFARNSVMMKQHKREPGAVFTFLQQDTTVISPTDSNDPETFDIKPWPMDLLQLALYNEDQRMLAYLLHTGNTYQAQVNDGQRKEKFLPVSKSDFIYALNAKVPALIEELISQAGAGIPLDAMVEKSGPDPANKPKFYQGLTVHGVKRQDWADAGRGETNYQRSETNNSPLLEAAKLSSLAVIQWFLSDAPMRCYGAFLENNKEDHRLKNIERLPGGASTAIAKFLNERSSLAIHSCIIGRNYKHHDYEAKLRYLISVMPGKIDARTKQGLTPLHIAVELYDDLAVKILIEAGADQMCRDSSNNNLVHRLLINRSVGDKKIIDKLTTMFELIDKRLVSGMMLERSNEHPGALTPLAKWLAKHQAGDMKENSEVLKLILRFSGGKELTLINGAGDTPLHVCIRQADYELCQIILEHDPSLYNRENATGRTPYEMAEDTDISARLSAAYQAIDHVYALRAAYGKRMGVSAHEMHNDLMHRHCSTFVEREDKDRRTDREKVWDLMNEHKQAQDGQGGAKRRMVTLNEANEVARRLASVKRSGSRRNYEEDYESDDADEITNDEIQSMMNSAARVV